MNFRRIVTKIRSTDFGGGVKYNGWRMEDEQNRHSTGFLRDHARSVDRASPRSTFRQHYERHRE